MTKQKALQISQSILLIVVGVLIACSLLNANILNYILASAILIYAIFLLFKAIYDDGSLIYLSGITSAVLIGLSVSIFASYINAITILTQVITVAVSSIGGIVIISGIVSLCQNRVNLGLTKVIVGAVLLTIGLVLILVPEVNAYTWCVFGILLALFGLYQFIMCFVKIKNTKRIK